MKNNTQKLFFHSGDPSTWPIIAATGVFAAIFGGVMYFHSYQSGFFILLLGVFFLLCSFFIFREESFNTGTFVNRTRVEYVFLPFMAVLYTDSFSIPKTYCMLGWLIGTSTKGNSSAQGMASGSGNWTETKSSGQGTGYLEDLYKAQDGDCALMKEMFQEHASKGVSLGKNADKLMMAGASAEDVEKMRASAEEANATAFKYAGLLESCRSGSRQTAAAISDANNSVRTIKAGVSGEVSAELGQGKTMPASIIQAAKDGAELDIKAKSLHFRETIDLVSFSDLVNFSSICNLALIYALFFVLVVQLYVFVSFVRSLLIKEYIFSYTGSLSSIRFTFWHLFGLVFSGWVFIFIVYSIVLTDMNVLKTKTLIGEIQANQAILGVKLETLRNFVFIEGGATPPSLLEGSSDTSGGCYTVFSEIDSEK